MLTDKQNLERQLATRIRLMADKIAFFYTNADSNGANISRALSDMIHICQNELKTINSNKNDMNSLLQLRKEDIIARILNR